MKFPLFRFIVIAFIFFIFSACTKTVDPPLASGEKVAVELQRVINENGIKRVYPVKANDVFPNFFPSNTGTKWDFSNGFIQINYGFGDSYNLNYLLRYAILPIYLENNIPVTALILYF
ncbi:MAG: hypothetical protein RL596_2497 [Bacteroidota bacterium]|jgi:hypothetical protein